MKNNEDMLFRKSRHGYDKEDVNNYILNLSKQLSNQANAIKNSNAENLELKEKLSDITKELEDEKATSTRLLYENKLLAKKILDTERENNDIYQDLCLKAGEVLVIAAEAAAEILRRAGSEAGCIVDEAKDTKNLLITNISTTSKEASKELTQSISNAVNDCVERINESINSVEALKEVPEEKKPKLRFINGN